MFRVKNYRTIKQLGRGSFGEVYKVKEDNGDICALKKILIEERIRKYIQGELDVINKQLIHENIILVHEHFIDTDQLFISMELCEGGDLGIYFLKNKPEMSERLDFMLDTVRGVNYLHNQEIVHRDLKPENLLLQDNGHRMTIKITDFGISRIKATRHDMFSTYIGSPCYMAPELEAHQEYSSPVDIFATGLIYFAVYKSCILANSFGVEALIPGHYNDKGHITFLNETLRKTRPSLSSFLTSYFIRSERDVGSLVYSMLRPNPADRPTAEVVLINTAEIRATYRQQQDITRYQTELEEKQRQIAQSQVEHRNVMKKMEDNYQQQVQSRDNQALHLKEENRQLQAANHELRNQIKMANSRSIKDPPTNLPHKLSHLQITKMDGASAMISGEETMVKMVYLSSTRLAVDILAVNPDIGNKVWRVLALPQGGALLGQFNKATQVDDRGKTVRTLPVSDPGRWVTDFVLLDQKEVLILQIGGFISKVNLSSGKQTAKYKVNIGWLYAGLAVDNNNILLVDSSHGKVLKYNVNNNNTEVKVQGLSRPTSIASIPAPQGTLYAVCECRANRVSLYNSRWEVQASIGGKRGSRDGELDGPWGVAVLPDHTLLVSDTNNHRISAYNTEGGFIKHVIQKQDGLQNPRCLSISQHNNQLWVVQGTESTISGKLKVYQILKP